MGARILGMMLAAGLLAVSCQRQTGPDEVDAEALEAIALVVEDELNAPAYAVQTLLRDASREAQVGWDQLYIHIAEEPEPVNWWLQRKGWLELSGAQFATRAAFILTKPAQDILAQPDRPWFEIEASEEARVDCRTAAAMASSGCEVELQLTPALTDAGRAAIGTLAEPLQPFEVTALVTLGADGWEVIDVASEGRQPRDMALTAVMGTPEARAAAARQANEAMNSRLASMAGETEPEVNLEAWTPPNYVEPPPPVAPLEAPAPRGRPDSPFRPGQ